jgi:hypothetical protein
MQVAWANIGFRTPVSRVSAAESRAFGSLRRWKIRSSNFTIPSQRRSRYHGILCFC